MNDGGFANGISGIPSGGPNNATGLILNQMLWHNSQQPVEQAKIVSSCNPGEVRWHSEGDCFIPGQAHINIALTSIILNVIFVVVIVFLILWLRDESRKRKLTNTKEK